MRRRSRDSIARCRRRAFIPVCQQALQRHYLPQDDRRALRIPQVFRRPILAGGVSPWRNHRAADSGPGDRGNCGPDRSAACSSKYSRSATGRIFCRSRASGTHGAARRHLRGQCRGNRQQPKPASWRPRGQYSTGSAVSCLKASVHSGRYRGRSGSGPE